MTLCRLEGQSGKLRCVPIDFVGEGVSTAGCLGAKIDAVFHLVASKSAAYSQIEPANPISSIF